MKNKKFRTVILVLLGFIAGILLSSFLRNFWFQFNILLTRNTLITIILKRRIKMKHLATAALMSLVLNIVNYSIDLLSKDLTLNDLSLIKLLTDFFVYFFSYLLGVLIITILSKIFSKKRTSSSWKN